MSGSFAELKGRVRELIDGGLQDRKVRGFLVAIATSLQTCEELGFKSDDFFSLGVEAEKKALLVFSRIRAEMP